MDTPGMIVDHGEERVVWLDARLRQRERNAVLAHELVHDERALFYDETTPRRLIEKEEVAVRREVARRLVPTDILDRLAASDDQVLAREVSELLDVPEDVIIEAVGLRARRASECRGVPGPGPSGRPGSASTVPARPQPDL